MTEWQPIATAPRDGTWIMITDGTCWPPDVVAWRKEKPRRRDRFGTIYCQVPAGWFVSSGGRSRFDPLTQGHLMTAAAWCALPHLQKLAKCSALEDLVASHNKARHTPHQC